MTRIIVWQLVTPTTENNNIRLVGVTRCQTIMRFNVYNFIAKISVDVDYSPCIGDTIINHIKKMRYSEIRVCLLSIEFFLLTLCLSIGNVHFETIENFFPNFSLFSNNVF